MCHRNAQQGFSTGMSHRNAQQGLSTGMCHRNDPQGCEQECSTGMCHRNVNRNDPQECVTGMLHRNAQQVSQQQCTIHAAGVATKRVPPHPPIQGPLRNVKGWGEGEASLGNAPEGGFPLFPQPFSFASQPCRRDQGVDILVNYEHRHPPPTPPTFLSDEKVARAETLRNPATFHIRIFIGNPIAREVPKKTFGFPFASPLA